MRSGEERPPRVSVGGAVPSGDGLVRGNGDPMVHWYTGDVSRRAGRLRDLVRTPFARLLLVLAVLGAVVAGVAASGSYSSDPAPLTGIHKIRHVIVVMQENRSFDSYFGTYPGADGLPRSDNGA